MKKITTILLSLLLIAVHASGQTTAQEVIDLLKTGKPVKLQPITYDFTGYKNILVKNILDLNGAKIKCDAMIQKGFNDNQFIFDVIKPGWIKSGTIDGPSGRSEAILEGWFNAIKLRPGAKVTDMVLKNCDKTAIMATGDRNTLTDTVWIQGCIIDSTARDGSGYGIFIQYATAIIEGNQISNVRHGVDMGGSPNPIAIIRNNVFRDCFYVPINQHKIDGTNTSGAGMEIVGNYFYDTYNPMKLVLPASGTVRIDSNYFAGTFLGTFDGINIPKGTNYTGGENMAPRPGISISKRTFQVGERIVLSTPLASTWSTGEVSSSISFREEFPVVKVIGCYYKGLEDTVTILVDGGPAPYFGFNAMSGGGRIEVWRGNIKIDDLPAEKFYDYRYLIYYHDSISIRVYDGTVYFDDIVKSGGYYDTFETSKIGIKIRYFGTAAVSRKPYNVSSGYRNLTVEVTNGYVELSK